MPKFRIVAEPQNFPDNYPEIEVFMKKNLETLKQNGTCQAYQAPVSQDGDSVASITDTPQPAATTDAKSEPSDPAKVKAAIEKYIQYLKGVYQDVEQARKVNRGFLRQSTVSSSRGGFFDLSAKQYAQCVKAYQVADYQIEDLESRLEITLMMLGVTSLEFGESSKVIAKRTVETTEVTSEEIHLSGYRHAFETGVRALEALKPQKADGDAKVNTKYDALDKGDVELFNTPATLCSTSAQSKHYNPEPSGCIMM